MPLIKTSNTTTAASVATTASATPVIVSDTGGAYAVSASVATTASIDEKKKSATTQHYKAKNTANLSTAEAAETATTTTTATTATTNSTNNHNKLETKRNRHKHSNSNRKHKTSLAKSVPATPVQVNPTTKTFVPSSTDYNDDDDPDYNDGMLYMPPYSYPHSSIDYSNITHSDHHNVFGGANTQQRQHVGNRSGEEQDADEVYREASADNYPLEMMHRHHHHHTQHNNDDDDDDGDSSSMAMITPPPPYDTPYHKQQQQHHPHHHSSLQHQHSAPQQKSRSEMPQTRKYLFNNRETFTISSSNGNSSSNSIHQQPAHTSSLGSTFTNAITPTKLSAAAAAMFAAPQMVHLNRKWSNLHRKRRRRNSSSGDSKELDKLVLQSVDWDENDIY